MSKALIYLCLSLTSVFGTLGACFGLSALIKSNREKGFLKSHAPPGVSVNINTDDVLFSGIVVAVISGVVSLVALTSLQSMVLPGWRSWGDKTKRLRGGLMLFFTLWLLAAHIPFTIFFATRKAGVRAWTAKGQELPHVAVVAAAKKLGSTDVYKDVQYLRLLEVFPWIAIFFGLLSVLAIFNSPRMSSTSDSHASSSHSRDAMSEKVRTEEIA